MICTSALQSYLCFIFYEIADSNLKDCISEYTMFHNHKCVIKISILMMNFHFHIFETIYKLQLAIKCRLRYFFQDAYKRLTSTGVHILFSSISFSLGWALSSFTSFSMKLNKKVLLPWIFYFVNI